MQENKSPIVEPHKKIFYSKARHLNFDEYCDRFGEWEMCGKRIFVKRTAAYYFKDAKLLQLLIVKHANLIKNSRFELEVLVQRADSSKEIATILILSVDVLIQEIVNLDEYSISG
jgi:hypothetical protein